MGTSPSTARNRFPGPLDAIARAVEGVVRERPDVLGIYLFGSQVSGDATEASDVDLGVLFDHRATFAELVGLESLLEKALGRSVDLIDVGHCKPFLALEIIRGERLYEREGRACDEFDLYVLRRAGDLAPFERERRRMVLTPSARTSKPEASP